MPGADITRLAEAIATDSSLQARYQELQQLGLPKDQMLAFLDPIVDQVNAAVMSAWTEPGRSIKMQQAVSVFALMGSKAYSAHSAGVTEALPQAEWSTFLAGFFAGGD